MRLSWKQRGAVVVVVVVGSGAPSRGQVYFRCTGGSPSVPAKVLSHPDSWKTDTSNLSTSAAEIVVLKTDSEQDNRDISSNGRRDPGSHLTL